MYPEAITETVFDFVPKQPNTQIINVNFLERLWGKYIRYSLMPQIFNLIATFLFDYLYKFMICYSSVHDNSRFT